MGKLREIIGKLRKITGRKSWAEIMGKSLIKKLFFGDCGTDYAELLAKPVRAITGKKL